MEITTFFAEKLTEFRKFLGWDEKESWHELEEVEADTEIPLDYLQRFERIALQDKAQLVEREEAVKVMEKAWSNWKLTGNALLIIGEMGGGMTSLINCSCTLYPQARILSQDMPVATPLQLVGTIGRLLGYPDSTNFADLSKALEENANPDEPSQVMVFENIERLFRRKLHGMDLLEELLLFIHNSKKHVYWLVSINRYTSYYLDQIIDFSSNFSSILRLQPISNEAIHKMIDDRNAGYEITYLKPEKMTSALAQKLEKVDDAGKQEILRTAFFKQMQGLVSGNISAALKYWIKSVVYCRDKKIYIRPYQLKPVGDLTLESLFVLEAILLHRSLTPSDIKSVMRDHSRNSQLRMENLIERDLIEASASSNGQPEYQINLLHMGNLKSAIRSRLNRKIK